MLCVFGDILSVMCACFLFMLLDLKATPLRCVFSILCALLQELSPIVINWHVVGTVEQGLLQTFCFPTTSRYSHGTDTYGGGVFTAVVRYCFKEHTIAPSVRDIQQYHPYHSTHGIVESNLPSGQSPTVLVLKNTLVDTVLCSQPDSNHISRRIPQLHVGVWVGGEYSSTDLHRRGLVTFLDVRIMWGALSFVPFLPITCTSIFQLGADSESSLPPPMRTTPNESRLRKRSFCFLPNWWISSMTSLSRQELENDVAAGYNFASLDSQHMGIWVKCS